MTQPRTLQELFTDESKWTQGALARDRTGCRLSHATDPYAAKWCLFGGFGKVYGYDETDARYRRAMRKLDQMSQEITDQGHCGLVGWQDSSKTNFQQIRQLIERYDL